MAPNYLLVRLRAISENDLEIAERLINFKIKLSMLKIISNATMMASYSNGLRFLYSGDSTAHPMGDCLSIFIACDDKNDCASYNECMG